MQAKLILRETGRASTSGRQMRREAARGGAACHLRRRMASRSEGDGICTLAGTLHTKSGTSPAKLTPGENSYLPRRYGTLPICGDGVRRRQEQAALLA